MLSGSEISSLNTGNRIGIFGGSFDPVHTGHVLVSVYTLEILDLDRLIVVPVFNPPHKKTVAPFEKRFEWLKKVFEGMEKVEVSDYEKGRGGVSYSIFTIEYFQRSTRQNRSLSLAKMRFLTLRNGTDTAISWKNPPWLFIRGTAGNLIMSTPGEY